MILIAHRLSTVARADVIYVLDHGRIVQSGSQADLVAADGLYRDMWLQQVNGDA
jgi:ABC-type multidrug transport system fused ATPase/permease subunit